MDFSTLQTKTGNTFLSDLLQTTNPYDVLERSSSTTSENTPPNSPEKQESIKTLHDKVINKLSYAQALTGTGQNPSPYLSCNNTATLSAQPSSQNRAAISETIEKQTKAYGCTTSEEVRTFTLKDTIITPKSQRRLFVSSPRPLKTKTKSYSEAFKGQSYSEAFKGQSSSKRKIEEQVPMEIGSPLKKQRTPEKNKTERKFCPSLQRQIRSSESTQNQRAKLNLTVELPTTFHEKPRKPVFSSLALPSKETATSIEILRKEILPPAPYEDRPVNLGGNKKALKKLLDCSSFNFKSVHSRISRIESPGAKTTIISKYYSGAEHRIDAQRPPAILDGRKYQRLAYQSGSGQNVYAQIVVSDIAIRCLETLRDRERLLNFIKKGFLQSFKNKTQYIIYIRDKI